MAYTWTRLGSRSMRCGQLQSEGAPSAPPAHGTGVLTDSGIWLEDVASILPVVRAPQGQLLTGLGSLLGWVWVDSLGRWVRAPRADLDLTDGVGLQELALVTVPVTARVGYFVWQAVGVGLTGGTLVELDAWCYIRRDINGGLA